MRAVAREKFGVKSFRPGQTELIRAVLAGEDAIGLLPTGAGKSLTFQLPSLFLDGLVVVVSPLIALMQDQQEKLEEREIAVEKLNSTLTTGEERAALKAIRKGQPELVYVTPERLENAEQVALLKKRGVSLFVVDEAHCVSEWGHDFRPAYLGLKEVIRELGSPPVLALTATATQEVVGDILQQLGIPEAEVIDTGIERENLTFEVLRTPRQGDKRAAILKILEETEGVGIIYVATIRAANELHAWLEGQGITAGLYHGKRKASDREETQRQFMENAYRVMVATNAFGLGIDKPDIRFVIHYQFPDSIERYYQEAGRAGRDRKASRAVLLYRLEDKRVQSFFLGGKYPGRAQAVKAAVALEGAARNGAVKLEELATLADIPLKRMKVIAAQLEAAEIAKRKRGKLELVRALTQEDADTLLGAYEERLASDRERLQTMMRYAQSPECRAQFLRDYFDGDRGEPCARCDNCKRMAGSVARAADELATEPGATKLSEKKLETLAASVTGERSAEIAGLSG